MKRAKGSDSRSSRNSRRNVICNECTKKTPISLEYWRNTHCKNVHPNLQNPTYSEPGHEKTISQHFAPKQRKVSFRNIIKGLC